MRLNDIIKKLCGLIVACFIAMAICIAITLCTGCQREMYPNVIIARDSVHTASHTESVRYVRDSSTVVVRVDTLGRIDTLRIYQQRDIYHNEASHDTIYQMLTDTSAISALVLKQEKMEREARERIDKERAEANTWKTAALIAGALAFAGAILLYVRQKG